MKRLILFLLAIAAWGQQAIGPSISTEQTAAWTSATAAGSTLTVATGGANTALVTLVQTSTITNGTLAFEGSDTPDASVTDNWFSVPCAAPNTTSNPSGFYGLQASTNIALHCNVIAHQRFRVRLAGALFGTGKVTTGIQMSSLGALAFPPAPQTSVIDNAGALVGTTVVSVKASAGSLYGWHLFNASTAVCYLQIFNVASGSVTLGTTVPTMAVGMNTLVASDVALPAPIAFGTAISVAATTTPTGSTVCPTSSGIAANLYFQ